MERHMKNFRFVGFTLCALTAILILGCNESPDGVQVKSAAPSVLATEKPVVKPSDPPLVRVTPKAAATIRDIVASQGVPGTQYLRLRVVPGGCQGFMHKLDLDPVVSPEDYTCESAGVKVVVFLRQKEMLRGADVDFGEVDGKQGFKIENPNFKGEAAKKWLAQLEKEKDVR
jgi:iron-sulfur cluster assembly accessory protein